VGNPGATDGSERNRTFGARITVVCLPPDGARRRVPSDNDRVSVTMVRADVAPPPTEEEVYRAFADALPDTALMVFGKDLRYQVVAGASSQTA
jgi:hypothetical protein